MRLHRTPRQAWPRPLGSEEQVYLSMLADRMRYLLDSPRETDESVLRHHLVVVFGPRRGLLPGTGGVEDQVYPVAGHFFFLKRSLLVTKWDFL